MGPFKFVVTVLLLVLFTGLTFLIRGVLAEVINTTWQQLYGRNFSWDDVPAEWRSSLQLINKIADNIFPIGVLLTLVVALVESFQKTREGRVTV
ncbi:MAG: hypothetical protein QXT28_09115 [Thermofilaceae archaeon]